MDGAESPGRAAGELARASQSLRAATVRRSQGWNEVCTLVDANLPVVQVERPRVFVVSLLD